MRWIEIVETTTSGCIAAISGSGNMQGSIGAGFDANGDYGIYPKPKKIDKKTGVIKRQKI